MFTPEDPRGDDVRRALHQQGWVHLRVRGASMRPTFLSGELIRVVPVTSVARGDVLTFVLDDAVVTHRVMRVTAAEIVCRGDNRYVADPPVAPEAVIGRVVEVVGRGPLSGGRRALAVVDARRALRAARMRVRRLLQESGLLVRQVLGRPVPTMEVTAGGTPELPAVEGWRVLRPADLSSAEGAGEPSEGAGSAAPLVVPAGIFSALDEARRGQVLASLRGRRALVCALPLERAGRLVRALGRVRGTLARVGVRVGAPGDGLLHAVVGAPPGVTHYFSGAALAAELKRAGMEVGRVESRPSDWGPIICARTGTTISTSDNTC